MENQNSNPQQETDIIVLLDYFKRGIKGFFRGIGNFFKDIFRIIINLLLVIKRYFILVVGCMIAFAVFGYFSEDIVPPAYNYELIVQPNYNSTNSLYQLVESYNAMVNNEELETANDPFFKNLRAIRITPIKSQNEDINLYYKTIDNSYSDNLIFKQNEDTIFLKQFLKENKISDFKNGITNPDYRFQRISLKLSQPISSQQIINKIISPFEKDPFYVRAKQSYLGAIELQIKYYSRTLQRIDTLLLALANGKVEKSDVQQTISIQGKAKSNMEDDLLKRSAQFTNILSDLEVKKNTYSDIVRIISSPQFVKNGVVKRGLTPFAIYGLIFSLLLIALIRLIKYLNNYEKTGKI